MRAPFGRLPDGTAVEIVTLRSDAIEMRVLTYGGIITSLRTADRTGRAADVVLGFETLDAYAAQHAYLGAIVGRYANRIAGARFELSGRTWTLAANNGPNHLHGGRIGFDRHVWTAETVHETGAEGIELSRVSPAGEEGYPGTLAVTVRYLLRGATLEVEYGATCDQPTHVNLSQHSYFDLSGGIATDVLGHVLTIAADRYTPVDATLIPTGELATVGGTPFDFRQPLAIGARIHDAHPQLVCGEGYDHNWVLDPARHQPAVTVVEPDSGRTLTIDTTEPGVQFYSGNQLDGTLIGRDGRAYTRHRGFCLETQHFPDTPHHPDFPTTVVGPGDSYRSRTTFTFGIV